MKCIECGIEADYVYNGNSLCEKHKTKRQYEHRSFLDEMHQQIGALSEQEKYFKEIGRSIFGRRKLEEEPEEEVKEDEV